MGGVTVTDSTYALTDEAGTVVNVVVASPEFIAQLPTLLGRPGVLAPPGLARLTAHRLSPADVAAGVGIGHGRNAQGWEDRRPQLRLPEGQTAPGQLLVEFSQLGPNRPEAVDVLVDGVLAGTITLGPNGTGRTTVERPATAATVEAGGAAQPVRARPT
jgi:hypothetical protein